MLRSIKFASKAANGHIKSAQSGLSSEFANLYVRVATQMEALSDQLFQVAEAYFTRNNSKISNWMKCNSAYSWYSTLDSTFNRINVAVEAMALSDGSHAILGQVADLSERLSAAYGTALIAEASGIIGETMRWDKTILISYSTEKAIKLTIESIAKLRETLAAGNAEFTARWHAVITQTLSSAGHNLAATTAIGSGNGGRWEEASDSLRASVKCLEYSVKALTRSADTSDALAMATANLWAKYAQLTMSISEVCLRNAQAYSTSNYSGIAGAKEGNHALVLSSLGFGHVDKHLAKVAESFAANQPEQVMFWINQTDLSLLCIEYWICSAKAAADSNKFDAMRWLAAGNCIRHRSALLKLEAEQLQKGKFKFVSSIVPNSSFSDVC